MLRSIGQNPTEQQIEDMIAEVDTDGNGICEYPEFLLLMSKKMQTQKKDHDEEMLEAFKTYDNTEKGYITIEDLRRVLKKYNDCLPEDQVRLLFRDLDIDGDGIISFKDFIRAMMPMPQD